MVNKIPLIAAFFKLRMNGTRYVNELDDRLVMTWDSERADERTAGRDVHADAAQLSGGPL